METGNKNTKFPKGVPDDYSCPSTKDTSQIVFACTVAFILEASNRSKITRHTAEPRNRAQLVMNNTAEQEKYDVKE